MEEFDLIVVGTGFASTFFLLRFLSLRPMTRVLVLDRGPNDSHAWRIANRHQMAHGGVLASIPFQETFENLTPEKPWVFTPGFGGSSNCWFACTPRLLPADFSLKSSYGVGCDWPLSYNDLEQFYCDAEEVMAVAGPSKSPFPRSRNYPQPPHRMNDVDRLLEAAYPGKYFVMPAARPTMPTGRRPRCCANGVCNLCPIDAKFTIQNELAHIYSDPRVSVRFNCQVIGLDVENGTCRGVHYNDGRREIDVRGSLVALGANPIFNAHILMNSGLRHPWLGSGLCEQVAFSCSIDLGNVDNYSGSTVATGHGYMLYDGPHRSESAACLIENFNMPQIRLERGKYRHRAYMKFIFEDIPAEKNRVSQSRVPSIPSVTFSGHSAYLERGMNRVKRGLNELLSPLPVEQMTIEATHATEGHMLGTARMGDDPQGSVVDRFQKVHRIRNVLALGGSSFPSISPANPTLTIAALSLWSAQHV